MTKDKIFNISGKIIATAMLATVTVGMIFLASSRKLPFMSEEEQSYGNIVTSSESEWEAPESNTVDNSDASSDEEQSSEESVHAFEDDLDGFEILPPSVASYEKFDNATHKLIRIDTSGYQGFSYGSTLLSMGYIITESDDVTRIYAQNGEDISEITAGLSLTCLRDGNGSPLFEDENGNYYYHASGEGMKPSSFDAKTDGIGFTCETPRYLGMQNSEIYRYCENGKFGYRTSALMVIMPMFREAFAFGDDGVGCVIQRRYDKVDYLIFYNEKAVTISMDYYPPATRDEEALGYFYFDDGLIRVRKQNPDNSYDSVLMDSSAKIIPLPSDYSLVSYTDSRILLEKDGRYGFMTSRLEWITLPEYTDAKPFYEGLAVVTGANGKKGVIDRNGDTVIPMIFDDISNCSDGLILAYEKENGMFLFAKTDK